MHQPGDDREPDVAESVMCDTVKLSQSCVTLCVLVCSAPAPSPGDDREPDEAESDDHTGHGGEGQSTAAAATHPAGHASSLHHSQGELAD